MTAPTLSIVLATPPGFNPGMAATELALRAFLGRHDLERDAACYRLVSFADRLAGLSPERRGAVVALAETGIATRSAFEHLDAILASSAILFWADYLHMGIYLRELAAVVAQSAGSDRAAAGAALRRVLLLEGAADETLDRAVTFGTTLLFNTLGDELDPAYGPGLRRFLTLAKRVWVRDALSAARVAHLRCDYEQGYFGVDSALLLTREDVLREAAEHGAGTPRHPGSVLTFFGREPAIRERLVATAAEVGAALGRPVRPLRWGDRGGFPHLDAAHPKIGDTNDATARVLLQDVAHAAAVVTDTYHLALIAWNLGVPAVAAFSAHSPHANDVSSGAEFNRRDKREVFYSQYDALDFLVRPEELDDDELFARRLRRLRDVLADTALQRAICTQIRAHADVVEASLARELRALLAKPVRR